MAEIARIQALWQNFSGAPGYTNFYSTDLSGNLNAAVRSFFNSIAGLLPSGLTVQVAGSGDRLLDTTGAIVNSWTNATPAVVLGTAGGTNTGASGAVVHWLTNGVVNGRRVRGRSFICPLSSGAFEGNGSLLAATMTTIGTAANGLITAAVGSYVVWHRPTLFASGSSHEVTSQRVPDLAAVLRSRRQ